MQKIRIVKLKRKNDFKSPIYKMFIDEKEINDIKNITINIDAKNPNITNISFGVITDDFQWLNEDSVELPDNNPTE